MKPVKPKYAKLLANMGLTIESARHNAIKAINKPQLPKAYSTFWQKLFKFVG